MTWLKLITPFLKTCLPYVFPDYKFQWRRAVALVSVCLLLGVSTHFFGLETTEDLADIASELVEVMEE